MTASAHAFAREIAEAGAGDRRVSITVMGSVTVTLRGVVYDAERGMIRGENCNNWPDLRDPIELADTASAPQYARRFACRVEFITGFWSTE